MEISLTTGTRISSEGLDPRRRRLLFRAWHRGIREVDLIMGGFADAHIGDLSAAEVDEFERLMDVQEHELLGWVTGQIAIPAESDSALLQRLCAFHRSGAA